MAEVGHHRIRQLAEGTNRGDDRHVLLGCTVQTSRIERIGSVQSSQISLLYDLYSFLMLRSRDDVFQQFQAHLEDLESRGIREEHDVSYDMETSFYEDRGGDLALTTSRLDNGGFFISLDEYFTRPYSWRDSVFLNFIDRIDVNESLRRELREEILEDYEEVPSESGRGWTYVLSSTELPLLFEVLDCSSIEDCEKKINDIVDDDGGATDFGVSFHQRLYRAGIRPQIAQDDFDDTVENMYTVEFLHSLGDDEFFHFR